MENKTCSKCKLSLPLSEFSIEKRRGKMYCRPDCKKCYDIRKNVYYQKNKQKIIDRNQKWATKHRDEIRIYNREWYKNHRESFLKRKSEKRDDKRREYERNYRKNEPIKKRARMTLKYHVRVGNIIKPENCERCHKKSLLNGHHSDYSKPLMVNWLCSQCHSDIHRNLPLEKTPSSS